VGPLYDFVGIGMRAYGGVAFKVRRLGATAFRLAPRTLIVSTHRRESDVPLIASELYFRASLWKNRSERMHFAARDDMFLPGFFAGFPPGLSPRARRLLFPVGVGRFLPRVQVHPLSSASSARLLELLRAGADEALEDVVPERLLAALRARSEERGLPAPRTTRDLLRGEYADLLWEPISRGEGPEGFWPARAAQATSHFRALVDVMRAGGSLLLFPEGRPSPDGEIGPLRRGVDALVRRAKPEWLRPVTIAYDPLVHGRTEVTVTIGAPFGTPQEGVEETVLACLRRTTPLTCGQYVAHELAEGREPHAAGLAAAVESARADGRPVGRPLLDFGRRAARLAEARAKADEKPAELPFLAREFASARA
jgi:hypothetical protein